MQLELPVAAHPFLDWAASELAATPDVLDRDPAELRKCFRQLAQAGWHELGSPRKHADAFQVLSGLVARSGALALLMSQQWQANQSLTVPEGEPWPKAGIAYGHLQHTDKHAPIWEDGKVYGRVPWMVGSGFFDYVLLGFRDMQGREMLAWVEAHDRPEFRHSSPLALASCQSVQAVWVDCEGLEISEDEITRIGPLGTFANREARQVIQQVPLLLGVAEYAAEILDKRPSRAPRAQRTVRDLRHRAERCRESGTPEEARKLRAEIGARAASMSLLCTMASGGYALQADRDPQRLYREALLFNLIGEDEAIVHAMADHLFPAT